MLVSIKLSNGKTIDNLEVNGNCLISDVNINNELLTDELLSDIIVNDTEYKNITLVRKWEQDNKVWIALRQKTDDELWKEKYSSDLDYIAMMASVDMEE